MYSVCTWVPLPCWIGEIGDKCWAAGTLPSNINKGANSSVVITLFKATVQLVANMTVVDAAWKALGEAKRQAVLDLIPEKWRIKDPIPPATEVRDVTGSYIQQFLSPREIEITETDALGIAQQTTSGNWTAVEVAEAFCHRAALAHQLVCFWMLQIHVRFRSEY